MTYQPEAPQQYAAPQYAPQPVEAPKQKNVLGLVALIVAAVGFLFACIPGALIVGWVLLPIAFILSIVAICLPRKKKALALTALIVSVVGTIVGVVVFMTVVATSFEEAFGTGETTAVVPSETAEATEDESEAAPAEAEAKEGTRDAPYPLGTAITQGDWTVTVNSVNLDATQAIVDENQFNEPATEGNTFILVNLTATYIGTAAEGDYPFLAVDYVTAGGNTVTAADTFVVAPEPFDMATTLYEGASTTGNIALSVPTEGIGDGVLAVTPGMVGDKVFVAVQ